MTREGYTHVLIPKSLHSVLKENTKEQEISISKYIQGLIENTAHNRAVTGSNPVRPILHGKIQEIGGMK
jgi:hypothetical protein